MNLVKSRNIRRNSAVLLAATLVIPFSIPGLGAQSAPATTQGVPAANSVPTQAPSAAPKPPAPAHASPYTPSHFPKRAAMYYEDVWGVDSLTVRSVESGELIRFNYHVLDAAKAGPLNDKKTEPTLIDPAAGVKLVVPSLEKVGQLRQSAPAEDGKIYWMAFSNKGGLVKRGDKVDVVIGQFRATGLVIE